MMENMPVTLVEFILKDGTSIKKEVGAQLKVRMPKGTIKYRFINALAIEPKKPGYKKIYAEGEYSHFIEVLQKK